MGAKGQKTIRVCCIIIVSIVVLIGAFVAIGFSTGGIHTGSRKQISAKNATITNPYSKLFLKCQGQFQCDVNVNYDSSISSALVQFVTLSNDDKIMDRIKSIDAQVVDNSLDVTVIGQDFNFWKLFYFSDTTTQINVTLPAVKLESARYESAVGSFDYNGNAEMDIGTVSFSASTGSIRVANVTMSSGEISSSTGTVTVRAASAKDIKISTSTGSIYGDVKGTSKVKATASTGSVEVDVGVASAESIVELSTNTGSVTSIITGFTGKYKGSTSTGSVKVVVAGSDVSSGKKESSGNVGDGRGDLKASTSTGSVNLTFK
ncbi:hypothetical protein BC833DRAFT_652125 [Globomyces pollinis-pini]|nr:hypothetical protein BC833DRAFT_652125 [Globomyces pollinis-pini]